jgi:peptidoglycan hydrolase-like protein with peptidoglycan-binding domain
MGYHVQAGRRTAVIGAVLIGIIGFSNGAAAQARPAPPAAAPGQPAAAPAQPDVALEAARIAFEALPESDRKAVQEALVWTGDYNASTGGVFGRRTYDGILAYQRRAKLKPDGILDAKARTDLQAAARKSRDAVKFAVLTDAKSGIQLGVPERLLPKRSDNANQGTRWQSADGKITLDTRTFAAGDTDLPALYERTIAMPVPGRQVTYKLLRPDFFVVSGETPTGKFYTRYAGGPGGIRGFSIGYDKLLAKDVDRLVIAIANSFVPFPGTQTAAPSAPASPAPAAAPLRPAGPTATGIVVGPRRVLTVAAIETCAEPRLRGARARLVRADRASGLALLETDADLRSAPLRVSAATPSSGEELLVLSYAAMGAERALAATPASTGASGRVVAPLQPGAGGAPILDRSGALTGVVGAVASAPVVVAGIAPPMSHAAIDKAAIAAFLGTDAPLAQASGAEASRSAGSVTASAASSVVSIDCAR